MNADSTVKSELHENEFENEKYTSTPQLHNNLKITLTIGRMNHSSFLLPNLTCMCFICSENKAFVRHDGSGWLWNK